MSQTLPPSSRGNAASSLQQSLALPSLSTPSSSTSRDTKVLSNNVSASSPAQAESELATLEHQLSQDLQVFLSNPSLRAALADGSLDLASYSGQVQQELRALESECIQVYRSKADEIQGLCADLRECQAVLAALQEMLLGFQADLGGLSGEIRQLQERSRDLDIQLRNRRRAANGLQDFLKHVLVAPNLVNTITTGPVDAVFLKCVKEVSSIYQDCFQTQPQDWSAGKPPCETAAGKEMQQEIIKLRLVAVTRIRDYFLKQMDLLRRPITNIRMIQVHGLLKYADLYDFLHEGACPEIATELYNVYVEIMSKTMLSLFRTYQTQLLQLDVTKYAATRQDVIAIDDALLRDSLTTRAKKRVDVFCLGQRAVECLEDEAASQPILAHLAIAENIRYPYERLFRSLVGHLVDAVTNEYVFCRQFFKRDAFGPLFHGTLGLLLEQLENYLFGCYDALCLLLMLKVTHYYRRVAHQRTIHSLDPFFDNVTKLLWPRLKTIMDAHARSLKQANSGKLGGVDLHPHYVSRRFAEFSCSVLLILNSKTMLPSTGFRSPAVAASHQPQTSAEQSLTPSTSPAKASSFTSPTFLNNSISNLSQSKSAGDKLLEDLSEMIDEFELLLERLAEEHTQKQRIVFLINNLDQVVCIFQERRVAGREFNRFLELLMRQRELFVEEELLSTGFSQMIAFIQVTELHLAQNSTGPYDVNVNVVEVLVSEFGSKWKSNIEQINRNVLSYFSNFRNGMEILKQVLTQLLLYYTRFHDIIRRVWKNKPPSFCKDLVSTHLILNEIKKYALAI